MLAYFDTSAFVPLLIAEPTSSACRRLFDAADDVATAALTYVETSAVLAQAQRLRRIDASALDAAMARLEILWGQLAVVEVDVRLIRDAARCARELGLRGYDAVHCAAAAQFGVADTVAIAGDHDLLRAWRGLGLAIADPVAEA